MHPINKGTSIRITSPLLSGLLYAFLIMGIATVLTSLLLLATSQDESTLPGYAYSIHALSLFIGGLVSGRRSGERGWYHGGMLGLAYGLIVLLVGFLGFDRGVNVQSLLLMGGAFVAGAFGGMLGVNARR